MTEKRYQKYCLKCIDRKSELARKDNLTDAEKLEWMICDIQPYSKYWRMGMPGVLRRAIKAVDAERK